MTSVFEWHAARASARAANMPVCLFRQRSGGCQAAIADGQSNRGKQSRRETFRRSIAAVGERRTAQNSAVKWRPEKGRQIIRGRLSGFFPNVKKCKNFQTFTTYSTYISAAAPALKRQARRAFFIAAAPVLSFRRGILPCVFLQRYAQTGNFMHEYTARAGLRRTVFRGGRNV